MGVQLLNVKKRYYCKSRYENIAVLVTLQFNGLHLRLFQTKVQSLQFPLNLFFFLPNKYKWTNNMETYLSKIF